MGRRRTRRETRDVSRAIGRLVQRLGVIADKVRDPKILDQLYAAGSALELAELASRAAPKEAALGLRQTFPDIADEPEGGEHGTP